MKEKFVNFVNNRPILFVILLMLVDFAFVIPFVIVMRVLGLSQEFIGIAAQVVNAALPLGIIAWLNWWEDTGFVTETRNTLSLVALAIFAYIPIALFGTVVFEADLTRYYLVSLFLTGLYEEALARGVVLRALLPRGKWSAVIIAAILFGLMHVSQSVMNGMPIEENLRQVMHAMPVAILYGAVRLRVNSIYPLIFFHMIYDLNIGLSGIFFKVHEITIPMDIALGVAAIAVSAYLLTKPSTVTIDGQPIDETGKPAATLQSASATA